MIGIFNIRYPAEDVKLCYEPVFIDLKTVIYNMLIKDGIEDASKTLGFASQISI